MAQATTATDTRAAGAAETRSPSRVRAQEILLAAAATALLALLGWLALSMVQVGEDIVRLRSAVAHNAENIVQLRRAVERNTETLQRNTQTLQRIEALLLAERSGGENAPRR